MVAPLPFSESEIRLPPVVTQDVDLWFENLGEQKMSTARRKVGAAYVPPSMENPPMLAGAGTELFDIVIRMDGLGPFAEEFKNCIDVPLGRRQLKVLALDRILASKIAANRPKDKLTIQILRDVLATTEHERHARKMEWPRSS